MYEVNKENAIEFKTQWHFLCNRKLRFHYIKKLRKDRTAADKKYVAYCDPPQAENLASEILSHRGFIIGEMNKAVSIYKEEKHVSNR